MSYDFESDDIREKVRADAEDRDIADRCETDADILSALGEVVAVNTLRHVALEVRRLRDANRLLILSAPSFKKNRLQRLHPHLADLLILP